MADMIAIARPYAKAAFEFAVEHSQIDQWASLLVHLAEIIADPLCVRFLTDPATTPEQHCQMLEAMLKKFKLTQTGDQGRHFIALLAHNKRLLVLASISQQFQELRSEYDKTLTVEVISFSELTKTQAKHLAERLSKRLQREVTLRVTLDPSILGGAIIRAGDLVFDSSVRTQIKNLGSILAA